jgi:hypothetical protein
MLRCGSLMFLHELSRCAFPMPKDRGFGYERSLRNALRRVGMLVVSAVSDEQTTSRKQASRIKAKTNSDAVGGSLVSQKDVILRHYGSQ